MLKDTGIPASIPNIKTSLLYQFKKRLKSEIENLTSRNLY